MSGRELPPSVSETLWYVLEGKEIRGPYSPAQMHDMVRDHTIGPDTRMARAGASEWQTLSALTDQMTAAATTARSLAGPLYAGFWIRVAAYILDAIIVNVCVFVLSFLVFFILGIAFAMKTGNGDMLNSWIAAHKLSLNLIGVVFWLGYETLFVAGKWQATPGKRICDIHVVRPSGARIGYGRALGRYLCYILDSITLFIGFMMAGWTEQKTALHDLMCDTRVVYGKPQPKAEAVASTF